MNVAVIPDNTIVGRVVSRHLTRLGYGIVGSGDGTRAKADAVIVNMAAEPIAPAKSESGTVK